MIKFDLFIDFIQNAISRLSIDIPNSYLLKTLQEILNAFKELAKNPNAKEKILDFTGFMQTLKEFGLVSKSSTGLSGRINEIVNQILLK